MWSAAEAVREVSAPSDLIFSINMHDRGIGIGGNNPAMFYLAERKGWNIQFRSSNLNDIVQQIDAATDSGARWLVVTWYTPDLEPCVASFVPLNLRRDPGVDGKSIMRGLERYYSVVLQGPNHAVLKLERR